MNDDTRPALPPLSVLLDEEDEYMQAVRASGQPIPGEAPGYVPAAEKRFLAGPPGYLLAQAEGIHRQQAADDAEFFLLNTLVEINVADIKQVIEDALPGLLEGATNFDARHGILGSDDWRMRAIYEAAFRARLGDLMTRIGGFGTA